MKGTPHHRWSYFQPETVQIVVKDLCLSEVAQGLNNETYLPTT